MSIWGRRLWLGTAVLALTFMVTVPFLLMAGVNPLAAFTQFLFVPLTSRFGLLEVGVASIPLLFTGVAVALAFRAGYWNIGAEGQLLLGAVAAAGIGTRVGGVAPPMALVLMMGGGALAGAVWALLPALLRVRFHIDEVVTTLLLNPVALLLVEGLLNGPWRDPVTRFPESPRIAATAEMPVIVAGSRLHLGFLIGFVIIVVVGFVLSRTRAGLELEAVGLAPEAARFAGVDVARTLVAAALISGAIAGLGGVGEVAGIQYRLTGGLSAGFGYTGIVVATLGGLRMGGVLLVALLLGDLTVGAGSAGRALGVPSQAGDIVSAAVLLVTVAMVAASRYGLRRRRPAAAGVKL